MKRSSVLCLLALFIGAPVGGARTVRARTVLAPAYTRLSPLDAPNSLPASTTPMTTQSHTEFTANWDRQVGCPGQYEPAASAAVWSEMLASDPVGATWGTGADDATSCR